MNAVLEAKRSLQKEYQQLEDVRYLNQKKVLSAYQSERVGAHCFTNSTGYGYDDAGRACLEGVFSTVFKGDAALVRPQIVSGTHAITLCLALLNPGDQLVSLSGQPYDSLLPVIGTKGSSTRSLLKRGIHYKEAPLDVNGRLDFERIRASVTMDTKMTMIQRSRGYSWRPSISIEEINQAFKIVKDCNPSCICFVDNCYGEFVEAREPIEVGANLIAGSLIKNPGGTLAPSGGYIVGDSRLVQECAECLTAPGLGGKVGPTFGLIRPLLQGFYLAPHIVGEALQGAMLAAQVFHGQGYPVSPLAREPRTDIIQAIQMDSKARLLAFCRGIQKASPIDSQFLPIPDSMPGYEDPVVMAGGTFIQGSSIELSADAPLRSPYIVYLQGGMCIEQVELGIESILTELQA